MLQRAKWVTQTLFLAVGVPSIAFAVDGRVAPRYFITAIPGTADGGVPYGINDRGQVTGGTSALEYTPSPFLWSPKVANGVDGSTITLDLPTITTPAGPFGGGWTTTLKYGAGFGINEYGQVSGIVQGWSGAFLWTPTQANGTQTATTILVGPSSGPLRPNEGLRINDYGQLGLSSSVAAFFTPNQANGSTGTITSLTTGAAANATYVLSLNDRGDAVGGGGSSGGFVFRPTGPHGLTGTIVPLDQTASAINNTGLVGTQNAIVRISDDATPVVTRRFPLSAYGVNAGRVIGLNDGGIAVTQNGYVWSEADGLIDVDTRLETHSGAGWQIISLRDVNEVGQMVGTAFLNQGLRYSVLLTPARDGDATLDQRVDFADLLTLAKSYNAAAKTWRDGDFTGDGAVGFDDLLLLAKNYQGAAGTALADADVSGAFAADFALAQSLVPEPGAGLAVIALASLPLRGRRR